LIFGRYDYRRTLRKSAAMIIGEDRARHLTPRDLRDAALTDLAEVTQSVGSVAADRQLESGPTTARITGTETGTELSGQSVEIILARKNRDGRVAQLDRALPSGGVEKSIIPCKNRGILLSSGSQKSQRKRIETQPNWHGASYENLDRARRAWGALRVV
jgi:hypothetical protein